MRCRPLLTSSSLVFKKSRLPRDTLYINNRELDTAKKRNAQQGQKESRGQVKVCPSRRRHIGTEMW